MCVSPNTTRNLHNAFPRVELEPEVWRAHLKPTAQPTAFGGAYRFTVRMEHMMRFISAKHGLRHDNKSGRSNLTFTLPHEEALVSDQRCHLAVPSPQDPRHPDGQLKTKRNKWKSRRCRQDAANMSSSVAACGTASVVSVLIIYPAVWFELDLRTGVLVCGLCGLLRFGLAGGILFATKEVLAGAAAGIFEAQGPRT